MTDEPGSKVATMASRARARFEVRWRQRAVRTSNGLSAAMLVAVILAATMTGRPREPAVRAASEGAEARHLMPATLVRTRTIQAIDVAVRREPSKPAAPPAAAVTNPPTVAGEVYGPPAPPPVWTDAEIATELRVCVGVLAPLQVEVEMRPPVKEVACGLPAPVAITRIGPDRVELQPPPVVNCAMASALHAWLTGVAQPAARELLGQPIARLVGTSGYACRNRNGAATTAISEHAFGNAIDLSGVVLADGRRIDVATHWGPAARDGAAPVGTVGKPTSSPSNARSPRTQATVLEASRSRLGGPVDRDAKAGTKTDAKTDAKQVAAVAVAAAGPSPESKFLRRLHGGACGRFATVLGPEANEAHRDHLHLDLKRRARTSVCQ